MSNTSTHSLVNVLPVYYMFICCTGACSTARDAPFQAAARTAVTAVRAADTSNASGTDSSRHRCCQPPVGAPWCHRRRWRIILQLRVSLRTNTLMVFRPCMGPGWASTLQLKSGGVPDVAFATCQLQCPPCQHHVAMHDTPAGCTTQSVNPELGIGCIPLVVKWHATRSRDVLRLWELSVPLLTVLTESKLE